MPTIQAHYLPDNYEAVINWVQERVTLSANTPQAAHDWLCKRLAQLLDESLAQGRDPLNGKLHFPCNSLGCLFTAIVHPFGPSLVLNLEQPLKVRVIEVSLYAYLQ